MTKEKRPSPALVLLISVGLSFLCCVGILALVLVTGDESPEAQPTEVTSRSVADQDASATPVSEVQQSPVPTMPTRVPSSDSPTAVPPADPTPTITPLVDAPRVLGLTTVEVEEILGQPTSITANDDSDDNLAGGEYRDYSIDGYGVAIAYDSQGIARVFQVLDGLSSQNYALSDWRQIFSRFGLGISQRPSEEAPAALYWDNLGGYAVALAASSSTGQPVWTIQIAEFGYGVR